MKTEEGLEMEDVIKIEKLGLVTTKDLCSKIIFIKDKSITMMMLEFRNGKEKDIMREKAIELIKSIGVDRYWFSSTAWFLTQDKDGKNIYRQPSRDVNRKECFMVTEFRKDRKNKIYFAEIKRDLHNEVTFLEDKEINEGMNKDNNLSSYWDAWADVKAMDVETHKMIRENNEKFIRNSVKEFMGKHKEEIDNVQNPEELTVLLAKLTKEFDEKLKEQDRTLLENPEEMEEFEE